MKKRYIKVAAIQSAPILFDKASAMDKIAQMTREAAGQGAALIVFPEVFVSGYPRGLSFGTRVGSRNADGRRDWARYWASAIDVPGRAGEGIGRVSGHRRSGAGAGIQYRHAVQFHRIHRSRWPIIRHSSQACPYRFGTTAMGSRGRQQLTVIDTPVGRIGGLICWENYMPLARMAMYAQGIDIYLAPTADARDTWQATIRHIACEGRCFVIACNQFATKASYPADVACYEDIKREPDILCRGGSAIVGPLGEYVVEPLYNEEGILIATLDLSEVTHSRFDFDVTGHYSRPDVFQLIVNDKKQEVVRTAGMS